MTVALNVNAMLGYVPLTDSVQTVAAGVPKVLPDKFYSTTRNVFGDKTKYFKYAGVRKVARIAPYGSPARSRALVSLSGKEFQLLHSIEKISMGQDFIRLVKMLRSGAAPWAANQIQDELDRQSEQFGILFENLRRAAIHAAVSKTILYFDVDGNLLNSSSGAATTVDYEVPAGNKGSVGGIISASWAITSTNIQLHMANLDTYSIQLTNRPLKYAIYGKNIPSYLVNNTSLQPYFARNSNFRDTIVGSGEIPDGVLGKTWIPAKLMYFVDDNDAVAEQFDGDQITFLPEIDKTTYAVDQGSYEVPKTLQPLKDLDEAMANIETVYGMFSFATLEINPVAMHRFSGDTFAPRLLVPESVFLVDTTP